MALRRGFKAEAERTASSLRFDLGLTPEDPIDICQVAGHFDAVVVDASELVELRRLEDLEDIQAFSFSACTFEIGDKTWIVVNPLRSPGRQASDVAHELGHKILGHTLGEIRLVDGIPFRTCQAEEEQEATVLGGTLLLPRPMLLKEAAAGATPKEIARKFGVTEEMARFRYNTTGVVKQTQRGK